MMKLLHLDASARTGSLSRRIAAEVVATLRGVDQSLEYRYRDLAAQPVPHISEAWTEICDNLMGAGITELDRLHEGARTDAQRAAWSIVEPLLDEVVAAEVILIATPMYNYSVPSALKAWIDQITFPRMNLGERRFVIVAVRGGSYAPGSPKERVEHQTRYLSDFVQGHFSVAAPEVVTVDLANARVDPLLAHRRGEHEASVEDAFQQAREVGTRLLKAGSSL
jgi:FMN-dependent NADH-azoreductase